MLSICLRGLAKITDEFFVGYFGKAIITRAYQTIRSRGKYGASLRKVRLDYVKKIMFAGTCLIIIVITVNGEI